MKKYCHAITRLFSLLIVSFTLLSFTAMATGAGGAGDPLVTLSYLNGKFAPEVLAKMDERLTARNETLSAALNEQIRKDSALLEEKYNKAGGSAGDQNGTADTFVVVSLTTGQVLNGEIGCEVLLRVGTASCVATSSPGLIDSTDAATIDNGASLAKNHLYMITMEGRGVKATAATTKLLVRGSYTIE